MLFWSISAPCLASCHPLMQRSRPADNPRLQRPDMTLGRGCFVPYLFVDSSFTFTFVPSASCFPLLLPLAGCSLLSLFTSFTAFALSNLGFVCFWWSLVWLLLHVLCPSSLVLLFVRFFIISTHFFPFFSSLYVLSSFLFTSSPLVINIYLIYFLALTFIAPNGLYFVFSFTQ